MNNSNGGVDIVYYWASPNSVGSKSDIAHVLLGSAQSRCSIFSY